MDDTLESLRHQRNLLAAALGNVLGAYGVIRRDAPMTAPELLLAAETAIEGKRHGKPRQPQVRPWHSPDTIPDNGSEFEYLVAGSDRVRLGACYNDFGGTVRAEPNTTAWRWPAGSVEAIFEEGNPAGRALEPTTAGRRLPSPASVEQGHVRLHDL